MTQFSYANTAALTENLKNESIKRNDSMSRDIIINRKLRMLSGCSEDSLVNCGNHTVMSQALDWMIFIDTVHFYCLPCVIGLGIIFAFVNCIILLRQIRSSIDSFILGMVISSLLLLLCSVVINLKLYVGHLDIFGYIYGYVKSSQEWFWYTSIWLLLIMCLERCMNMSATRNRALCSPFQAGITVVMTYLVCLVSALPRYWEFEPMNHQDPLTNRTSIVATKSATTNTPEYNVMYYWYIKVITLFLPQPAMLIVIIVLCCGVKKPAACKRQLSKKHSTGQVMNRKVTEEIRLTQLLVAFTLIYVLLTTPYTIIKLLYKLLPMTVVPTDPFFASLEKAFQVLFYLNYMLHFVWLIAFNWGYRKACRNTCCCCCCSKTESDYELAPQRNDYY